MNKAGYDNPKHQQARNKIASSKGKSPNIGKVSSMSFASSTSKRGTIDNYSKLSFSNNTKSAMDKMLKTDNTFKIVGENVIFLKEYLEKTTGKTLDVLSSENFYKWQ
jgi:hypothetical protein